MPFSSVEFAKFIAQTDAVTFGDFVLKSGKKSKVFFNFGKLVLGRELLALGGFFADFIVHHALDDAGVLFGPAYKGINIAIATSIALHKKYGRSIPFVYDRKTEKDHAEGGKFVGFDLSAAKSALILDDVFTDGATKYDALKMLSRFEKLVVKAIIIGIDRQEVDDAGRPYLALFKEKTGVDVFALSTKEEVLALKDVP